MTQDRRPDKRQQTALATQARRVERLKLRRRALRRALVKVEVQIREEHKHLRLLVQSLTWPPGIDVLPGTSDLLPGERD